jgi:ribokinase
VSTAAETVAVVGYASLDRAMALSTAPGPAGTALVRRRLSRPWPAPGGLAYLAATLATAGIAAEAVSWVGRDDDGTSYTAELRRRGVGVRGIAAGCDRTPSTYLFYSPDGGTTCVYDPGDQHPERLNEGQREVLAGSTWVCLMVSPRGVVTDVLDGLDPTANLVWTVKADPDAFPPELVRRILARADVVTFNAGERAFLERAAGPGGLAAAAAPDTLLVETSGGATVRYWTGAGTPVTRTFTPVDVADTTGAGDAFCGGLVARLLRRPGNVAEAFDAAIEAATGLLRARAASDRVNDPKRPDGTGNTEQSTDR